MPDAQHFIVATAGDVDHGKSALIKTLTGTDPECLPEEKPRGITIDLGFAHLDYVKNLVVGVGSIDLALLVVAADDGWMPQTEEHFRSLTTSAYARRGGPDQSRSHVPTNHSRRAVVPLLEYLDRSFVTLRQGDKRTVRR